MSVEALRGLSNKNSAVTVFELAARQDSLAPRGRVILKTDLGAKWSPFNTAGSVFEITSRKDVVRVLQKPIMIYYVPVLCVFMFM